MTFPVEITTPLLNKKFNIYSRLDCRFSDAMNYFRSEISWSSVLFVYFLYNPVSVNNNLDLLEYIVKK